jgi:hypothetical protein
MRPYRLMDETLDDEDDGQPSVVSLTAGGRPRLSSGGPSDRHEAWIPRGTATPAAPPREAVPLASIEPSFTRTHRWMLFGFLIVCAGMILGMVLVRVWDEASRAVAALPPEGAAVVARPAGQPAVPPPAPSVEPVEAAAPAGPGGAVTTEIRVLPPNYTVAPGETLGIIARRHGTTVEALASINNLENRNSLAVGQKLIIP